MSRKVAFKIPVTTHSSPYCRVTAVSEGSAALTTPLLPRQLPQAKGDLASTLSVHKCAYLACSLQKEHLGFEMLSPTHNCSSSPGLLSLCQCLQIQFRTSSQNLMLYFYSSEYLIWHMKTISASSIWWYQRYFLLHYSVSSEENFMQ